MKLKALSQNDKMKRSSKDGQFRLYHFGIPAFRSESGIITCRKARHCVSGCYAYVKSSSYQRLPVVKSKYETRLRDLVAGKWRSNMVHDLSTLLTAKDKRPLLIRINDSGDLYSKQYRKEFIQLSKLFPNVLFYAYTKEVRWAKLVQKYGLLPKNVTLIVSYGGSQDHLIDPNRDRHSKVFENEADLLAAGYVNASHDDTIASQSENFKIGLCYHGSKSYAKTSWSQVS